MSIDGAIFDCDGTLVDSMPMWFGVVAELMEAHGLAPDHEFIRETESLNLEDECALLAEHYDLGADADELLDELLSLVEGHYAHDVHAFPGVREFLDSLEGASIPRVVATSTPERSVWVALRAQGLDHYFDRVICTSDVGRGKDYPDVYEEAQRYLGTPRHTTWVFEDAPFGVGTSHAAGYPVVCILNDHDGRDAAWLGERCEILSHDWDAVSLAAITDLPEEVRE